MQLVDLVPRLTLNYDIVCCLLAAVHWCSMIKPQTAKQTPVPKKADNVMSPTLI